MSRLHAPDDDEKPFIARWNVLTRVLLVDPSVKTVARSAMDFGDFDDGTSCHPSNKRIERETGLSDRAVRTAWQALRGMGMAERVAFGSPHRRLADEYRLMIPENWRGLPTYGPHVRDFRCLYCEKQFTPQGNCTVTIKGGQELVTYNLRKLSFCPAPRAKRGRDAVDCHLEWDASQRACGERLYGEHGPNDAWKLFRRARADEW
ncbi:hypothetical protein [Micromonospora sp. NPDC005174]|uniref:hypothetical protein n=1 Tax=Micromonospora sp. NPDC005174 TaxID=3157018 RepID=UPI0033A3D1BA